MKRIFLVVASLLLSATASATTEKMDRRVAQFQ